MINALTARRNSNEADRVSDLRKLVKELSALADSDYKYSSGWFNSDYDRSDRETFRELFKWAEASLSTPRAKLASVLVVSQPMLEAWATGEGAPLPRFRRTTLRALANIGHQRL